MDLVAGEEALRRHAERGRHPGTVVGDVFGAVVRSDPGIEARIDPARHAAGAGEERVPDAGEPRERMGGERRRHGQNPGKPASRGAEKPITLNSAPIWPGPVPVSRSSAAVTTAR